ncbi:hypothetical protein QTP86_012948 [Hemibagrus guttatus]|nr:hypothetical protein QTP86_012948 [Hemibagrus guttatus]
MRKNVIEIYQSGKGYKAISKALGLPRTTVRAIIYKWRKHGTVENLPRSGRPTKITPRAQRQLIQEDTKDPTTTSKELQASLASVKSALARLTHTQKYIFEAILSIFGKDIANNITIMVNFADGQKPPVLEAIKAADIPCGKKEDGTHLHFKFNNSALFAQNIDLDDEENFDEMFWKMGKGSMKRFFTHLEKMETKSLQLTKESSKSHPDWSGET